MARAKKSVGIGEWYRACHNLGRVWEVDAVYTEGVLHPHAHLHAVEAPSEHRTIAISVLLDRERFEPIERTPDDRS